MLYLSSTVLCEVHVELMSDMPERLSRTFGCLPEAFGPCAFGILQQSVIEGISLASDAGQQ